MKKNAGILLSVLLYAWLCSMPVLCSAGEMYQISSAELTRLEANLNAMASINGRQKKESATLKSQLAASQSQLTEAEKQFQKLKEQLDALKLAQEKQAASLQKANELLKQYAAEEQYRLRKIKRQRNIAYAIAAASLYFVVRRG